jgi:hypothetical protein
MIEVRMAERRYTLIVGIVLGACLPGCLRPFGQRQEYVAPLMSGSPGAMGPAANSAAIRTGNDTPMAGKKEQPSPPQAVSGMLLLPTLGEGHTPKPDKKPDFMQSSILEGPDLTALGAPASSGNAPVPENKPDFLGQLGPATTTPPNSEEASEPPALKVGVQTIQSDYPSKETFLDVFHCFLADQPGKAIELLNGYDAAKQNIFMTLLPVIAGLSQKPREPLSPAEVEMILDQIENLADSLRPRSQLIITKMCFCKSIKAYAMYDPLPEDHVFRASSNGHCLDGDVVQVYVELGNFCCERRDDYHEIHLSSSVEIRPAREAKAIWFKRFDDSKQPPVRSRAQLHDYFCRYYFAVPHLPAGDYIMTIKVVDETFPDKRRAAEKSMPIRIRAAHPTTS